MAHIDKLPLELLDLIRTVLEQHQGSYNIVYDNDSLIKIVSVHGDQFFFLFKKHEIDKSSPLVIQWFPSSTKSTSPISTRTSASSVKNYLDSWFDLVKKYQSHISFFNDPILQRYFEEFSQQFMSTDADAEHAPFSIEHQMQIDTHLEKLIAACSEFQKTAPDQVKQEINSAIEDANDLRTTMSRLPKNKVLSHLCGIWSKIQKWGGVQLMKEITIKVIANIISNKLTS